jgi:hypothetical protein
VHLQINIANVDEKSKLSTAEQHHARNGVGLSFGNRRDALIEIEQLQLKWSCHAQNSTLDVETVPMGDEAASRRVKAKPCGSVTKGLPHIAKVVGAGTISQKNVEKSLTGRGQRDDRRAPADCSARPTPLTPTNTFQSLN